VDLCAPCDHYVREGWGEWLQLEDCCLNCRHLEDLLPCPILRERLYPSTKGVILSTPAITTCAVTGGSGGAGGET